MKRFKNKFMNKKGFTLIELIVVMAVIGILVLLAAPRFLGYTKDANVTAMKADTKVIENVGLVYNVEKEVFPFAEASEGVFAEAITPGAELLAVLPTWNHDADDGTTPEVKVPVYNINFDKIDENIKSLKGDRTKYVMDKDGNVYHTEGVTDRKAVKHFN